MVLNRCVADCRKGVSMFCNIEPKEDGNYCVMWKHDYYFKNAAGEEYEPEECQDCGWFDTEEEAVEFGKNYLPPSANWGVFSKEYLLG